MMVQHQYVDQVTNFSKKELKKVLRSVEPPICLIGGWAVYFQVNKEFKRSNGREYIGSRDIDLGIHVDPEWSSTKITETTVERTMDRIENLGYEKSRFGFLKRFHRENQSEIKKEEAKKLPMHNVFNMYLDLIPDSTQLDSFEEAFGFRPPAELLLQKVFNDAENTYTQSLNDLIELRIPDSIVIPKPELLAAMKISSIPDRDKRHKRIKDIADLHALVWYADEYEKIKEKIKGVIPSNDLKTLKKIKPNKAYKNASQLLGVEENLIKNSINNLIKE